MERSEKIQLFRGFLQLVGICMIVLALMYAMDLKERHGCDLRECGYKACPDCQEEPTGLYGNCDWLQENLMYSPDARLNTNTKDNIFTKNLDILD